MPDTARSVRWTQAPSASYSETLGRYVDEVMIIPGTPGSSGHDSNEVVVAISRDELVGLAEPQRFVFTNPQGSPRIVVVVDRVELAASSARWHRRPGGRH